MNLPVLSRFMEIPDRHAYGSQISEQTRCQKLFRVLSLLKKASIRGQRPRGLSAVGMFKPAEPAAGVIVMVNYSDEHRPDSESFGSVCMVAVDRSRSHCDPVRDPQCRLQAE